MKTTGIGFKSHHHLHGNNNTSPERKTLNNINLNNQSLPSTPNSNHTSQHNGNGNVYYPSNVGNSSNNNSSTIAYAISPLNQINNKSVTSFTATTMTTTLTTTNAKAPLVNTKNNESFDVEDDDDDEEDEDDCYERPPNLKHKPVESPAATKTDNFNHQQQQQIVYADSSSIQQQYDQVDASLYEPTVMLDANVNVNNHHYEDHEELVIGTALVMYSFEGAVQNAMSIEENESLNVLEKDSGDGWTLVKRLSGEKGYVPTDYIRIVYY